MRREDEVDAIQRAWLRERPGTQVESIGVLTRIRLIAKLLEDDQRRALAGLEVDASTRDLLSALRRAGPPYRLAPSELAQRALVSAGAVSQRVARAEARGLVRRLPSEADGRGVLVELTAAGHELIERTVDRLLAHEAGLLEALSGEERRELSGLLRTLLADLTERVARR